MNNNIINEFMSFKINRLIKYGQLILDGDDNSFIVKCLTRYLNGYIDFKYYHLLDVISKSLNYSYSDFSQELDGIAIELKHDYQVYELIVSNEEYKKNMLLIDTIKDVAFFVAKLDGFKYESKDEVSDKVSEAVEKNKLIKDLLGNKVNKLISLVKSTYNTENKFLQDNDSYFKLEFRELKERENYFYTSLTYDIKVLESNYKYNLVEKVYQQEKLDEDKAIILIQLLSKYMLMELLEKKKVSHYFINVSSNLIKRNEWLIKDIINNPIIKEHLIFMVDFNTYLGHKNLFLANQEYSFACLINMLHINDVYTKLTSIEAEHFFKFIVVSDFKYKDRKEFDKYNCSTSEAIFISKES